MKQTKKILSAALCGTITLTVLAFPNAFSLAEDVTVELDGNKIDFDVKPQIIDGRTMVPLRKIFEEIGALVKWDGETQTVSARKNSKTVSLAISSDQLQIDKGDTDSDGNPITETVTLEVPAQIVSGRTLVPARAVSEAFGLEVDWDEKEKKVTITSDDEEDESWKENEGTINLSDLTYSGDGIAIDGKAISITSGGDFTLSGILEGGNITVSTKEKVKLRLNDVSVTSYENPCIYVEDADKVYITLADGTESFLNAENSEDGAVYSKENLEIKGSGTLNVTSTAGHAVKASDNLTIENGTLNLTAFNDGIHINDTFKMTGGTVDISADGDGIDSESIVNISGGAINIKTNGVPIESTAPTAQPESTGEEITEETGNMPHGRMWGGMPEESTEIEFEKSSKGINAEWMMCISGGETAVEAASHAIHCEDEIEITGGSFNLSSVYEKGISAHGNLTIDGSNTVIDITKSTEGIESKNVMTINDGAIKIVSSDDGINATGGNSGEMMPGGGEMMPGEGRQQPGQMPDDTAVQPGEGRPEIGQMPDGTAAQPGGGRQRPGRIPFNRANQSAEGADTATDGKLPPADETGTPPPLPDGASMPQMNSENGTITERNFMGGARRNMKDCLIINGGELEIFAGDDCIDANGNLIINGGTVKATKSDGSFSGTLGIIDPDGQVTISENATLIFAAGDRTERKLTLAQNTVTVYCEEEHTANDSITVTDSDGEVIFEYTPPGNFKSVLISSQKLETDKTYTVTIADEVHTVQISQQNTVSGSEPELNADFGRRAFMQ